MGAVENNSIKKKTKTKTRTNTKTKTAGGRWKMI